MKALKRIMPERFLNLMRPFYHFSLAFLGVLVHRFPSRKIKVIAVTGTKGKSTVTEIVGAILEEAGFKTALANTLRFKIGSYTERNLFKMTMPGRFFVQRFLWQAVKEECQYAVIEMTSEGARQFRHKFIELDALIFTNLSPEHIESHGSYENYVKAKLKIAHSLARSSKKRKVLIINDDEKEAEKFKAIKNAEKIFYSLKDAEDLELKENETSFKWNGLSIENKLVGEFNVYNTLAALTFAKTFGIDLNKAKQAVEKIKKIRGRVEEIEGPGFKIYVDYAHTSDSLEKLYQAFEKAKKICVLGNTGGGRDAWKRPEMGRLANKYCEKIILTNEDPYDEDPKKIIEEMAISVSKEKLKIILDRRKAINTALNEATRLSLKNEKRLSFVANNVVVLITGKGTDPFIMGPRGTKIPWDDAEVVREEIEKI